MAAAGDLRCRTVRQAVGQWILTGFSQFQNNHVPGDDSAQATLSNGEIFIKGGRKASILHPGGRLHHADAQRALLTPEYRE